MGQGEIIQVWSTLKTKLNYYDRWGKVRSMTKTTQDNDLINRIGVFFAENKTELIWLIRQGAIYDENDTRQQHDQSYKVQATPETKLYILDWLDQVWSVMKMRHDNDVIDRIGAICIKNETKLS